MQRPSETREIQTHRGLTSRWNTARGPRCPSAQPSSISSSQHNRKQGSALLVADNARANITQQRVILSSCTILYICTLLAWKMCLSSLVRFPYQKKTCSLVEVFTLHRHGRTHRPLGKIIREGNTEAAVAKVTITRKSHIPKFLPSRTVVPRVRLV
jgi:hypothetical protein